MGRFKCIIWIGWMAIATIGCGGSTSNVNWKEGDILFQDGACGDFCDAIRKVTSGYEGMGFSHNGLLVKEGKDWMVLEAISSGVTLTPLDTFLLRSINDEGQPKVIVGRLKEPHRPLIPDAIMVGKSMIGKPYDHAFDFFNDAYYCSELIHVAFMKANLGHPVFEVSPMTFKDPDTQDLFPVWETYFDDLGVPVPEGEPGLNPGSMSLDPSLEIIYSFSSVD
jgi:hypothetical protein